MLEIVNEKINRLEGFSGKLERLIVFTDDDFSELFLFKPVMTLKELKEFYQRF